MIYWKEKLFLNALPDYLIRELLTYNFWDETEKKIIENMYIHNKSINNMVANKIINYERTQAFKYYKNGLSKLKDFLKTTQNPTYTKLYKIII